jgi:hypothetical protein
MARSFVSVAPALVLLSLLVPPELKGQGNQSQERQVYVQVVADHFQISTSEAELLLEGRFAIDNLPVVLFVSRETGLAPSAVVALRRSGTSWMAVARRLTLTAARFHVAIPEGDVDERTRRAHDLYRTVPQGEWSRIELTDEEVITFVHLRVFADQLRASPGATLRARAAAASWVEVPARLMARR